MKNKDVFITGLGVIAPGGIGKNDFGRFLKKGASAIARVSAFGVSGFPVKIAGEVKRFDAEGYLGSKGLRNLDRNALFLLVAAKQALGDAKLEINDSNASEFGVCTGTTFSHLSSLIEFDRDVFTNGIDFANPALFPSTVINAASSQVSIRFNIQGFNATVSSGYASGIDALSYSCSALAGRRAEIILCTGVETLNPALFFGFQKLGYMAGLKGKPLSCPYDKRRNGPVLGEGATALAIESDLAAAKKRGAAAYARVRSCESFFDGFHPGKIHPRGEGLEKSIRMALDKSGLSCGSIDYISGCANSTQDLDRIEADTLKKVFGRKLSAIPVSSIKSMLGETIAASAGLQIVSCINAMVSGLVPPTINFKVKDPECDIDCVPNKAQKKDVRFALVTSSGPGGYNGACVLEKYK